MGENFFVNINCSRILVENDETQYTMFIDSTKISIVYELVEWIRWMFSLEYCIYLLHENSVIHELEDIRLLSKLKNLEIKPCGRSFCVHKTTYRALLSNLNLFVSWNEVKVHKYFVDKISQIDQKLSQENSSANTGMIISSNGITQKASVDCKNSNIRTVNDNFFFPCSQPSNSSMKDSSVIKKSALIDNLKSVPVTNEEMKLKMKSSFDESPVKCSLKNILEIEQVSSNYAKSKSKSRQSSNKHFKPFSVGEILSNIRKDFEKQNTEVTTIKNSSMNDSLPEKDFNDKMIKENFLMSENKITEIKKKRRTRRTRKSKKQNLGSETFILPFLGSDSAMSNLNSFKSNNGFKPNHIRFDVDDEDNSVGNNFVESDKNTQNENEFETIHEKMNDLNSLTFFKAEPEKFAQVTNDNYKVLSDSQLLNSSIINTENEMDCSAVDDLIQEEKQTDLGDQISSNINQSCSEAENFQSISFNPDLKILVSLKENCKKSVVIKRFY